MALTSILISASAGPHTGVGASTREAAFGGVNESARIMGLLRLNSLIPSLAATIASAMRMAARPSSIEGVTGRWARIASANDATSPA